MVRRPRAGRIVAEVVVTAWQRRGPARYFIADGTAELRRAGGDRARRPLLA
jgi:hypothetical protein